MKPFIVCHMMASLDGRIDCDMLEACGEAKPYYTILDDYNCTAFIEGKTTCVKHSALPGEFKNPDGAKPVAKTAFFKATDSQKYEVCFDTNGTLLWAGSEIGGKKLICVTSENATQAYLDYLCENGISYIAVGKGKIDIAQAMEILNREFGVERAALVGGGHINAAFLEAGLIDEISMLYGAIIDGRAGMAAAFDGLSPETKPKLPKLQEVKRMEDDSVWMRYLVR